MNALDEYLQEKTAGGFSAGWNQGVQALPSEMGRKLPGVLASSGAQAAIGLGVAGIGVAASKIYGAVTKRRDFRSMMGANPDLEDKYRQDPKLFNQMYSTLRRFSPQFASDPTVAGTYMRQMSESPITAGGIAVQALVAHGDTAKLRSPFVSKALEGAAKHEVSFDPIGGLRSQEKYEDENLQRKGKAMAARASMEHPLYQRERVVGEKEKLHKLEQREAKFKPATP